uniref:Xylulose kinase-1 n=1 Tax=Tanacetum cinerariifolium TaxID=118510 RepID=A0A6L2LL96_TANCI|nr:hypothetical protein [Tanacetum cinerariifolium]
MVACLNKSDASEGFNQVIDFLNGSYIKYALTVNPNIYVSCIKQFWNTVVVKQDNDVTSLVRNVDSTSKFYMYPHFIQLLIKKQLGDLSTHTTKYTSPALTHKVFTNMRRVGKGFSRVATPLFKGMIVEQVIEEGGAEREHVEDDTATHGDDTTVQGDATQEPFIPSPTPPTPPTQQPQDLPSTSQHLEYDKVAQALEITKLKKRVKKLEKGNRVKVLKLRRLKKVGTSQRIDTSKDTVMEDASNQGRMIDDLDKDDVVALMDDKEEEEEEAKVGEDDQVQGRQAESQAEIYKIVMDHASKVLITAASTIVSTVEPQVLAATITVAPKKAKEDPAIQRYQVMKKRPQKKAQVQKNMIMYLKNVAGFRLDYFKGMSYDDIRPIFETKFNSNIEFLLKTKEQMKEEESKAIQGINETPTQKAAKRRKLNEEVEDLKRHLEIVPDEDDDIYTEATPLARKVPVVDYEIIHLNNKPHYKII